MVPSAIRVADPFCLVKLVNTEVDEDSGDGCSMRRWRSRSQV